MDPSLCTMLLIYGHVGEKKVWLLSTGGTVICNKSSVIIGVLGKVYRDTHDINRTTSKTKKKLRI